MKSNYVIGTEVLGAGVLDMIPILSAFTGGDKKADSGDAVKKALEQERARLAAEKAQRDTATTRMLLIGLLSMVGIGGLAAVAVYLKK